MKGSSAVSHEKWIAIRHITFIGAVVETFTECDGLFLRVENFRLREVEHIIGVEIFLEAVDVISP